MSRHFMPFSLNVKPRGPTLQTIHFHGKDEKMFRPYPRNPFIYHAQSNYAFMKLGYTWPILARAQMSKHEECS